MAESLGHFAFLLVGDLEEGRAHFSLLEHIGDQVQGLVDAAKGIGELVCREHEAVVLGFPGGVCLLDGVLVVLDLGFEPEQDLA